MTCIRAILVLALGLALGGCQTVKDLTSNLGKLIDAPRKAFASRDANVTAQADGRFQAELDPSLIRSIGGPRSPGLAAHVEEEVKKKGLCSGGIRVVSEFWGKDFYGVNGECK
jgi:hypothetical protein